MFYTHLNLLGAIPEVSDQNSNISFPIKSTQKIFAYLFSKISPLGRFSYQYHKTQLGIKINSFIPLFLIEKMSFLLPQHINRNSPLGTII